MSVIDVGVFGATGYTGLELIRLLAGHPQVRILFATSESSAGGSLRASHPLAPDLPLVAAADAPVDAVDAVFLCLPHTQSARAAARALDAGARVIDLSADLRLDDPAVYEAWYRSEHPHPELLPVPYGVPELGRGPLTGARCIANPGCYATSVLLAAAPLVRQGCLRADQPLIVDAKSGTSGAGRTPKANLLFSEVHGNLSPYNIGRTHRHLAEIEQQLRKEGDGWGPLIFTPHLLPTDRGILSAVYAPVHDAQAAQAALTDFYAGEPLVTVLPPGELATLAHVVRTPRAVLSLSPVTDTLLIVMVALDNLLKGAASQAVQNFNLMVGLPETTGLLGGV
jgi:N-acetyl-gamma-glutamyl-phosphate reductase